MTEIPEAPFPVSVEEPEGYVHPLIHFKGELSNIEWETKEFDDRKSHQATFNFIDVTVIRSVEPYILPIANIRFNMSRAANTRWAAMTSSFRKIVPLEAYAGMETPPNILVGKMQEWALSTVPLTGINQDTGKFEVKDREAWQLVSVEGFTDSSGPSLMELVVENSDGKNKEEISNWIFTDQPIKSYPGHTDLV